MIGFLIGLFTYALISLYASVGLSGTAIGVAIAIQLSLSAVTSVAVLFLIFKPVRRKDSNEKTH